LNIPVHFKKLIFTGGSISGQIHDRVIKSAPRGELSYREKRRGPENNKKDDKKKITGPVKTCRREIVKIDDGQSDGDRQKPALCSCYHGSHNRDCPDDQQVLPAA
jgi:hypothetical protein